jgi:thiol-disulfide isomerase/thioredoxin
MKKASFALLIFVSASAMCQSFNDCADIYANRDNKVELDMITHKIAYKKGDSLRRALDLEFQTCIMGKQIFYDSLVKGSISGDKAESLNGKVVLLNFWRVNCGPCIAEIPFLNRLHTLYKGNKDFAFVSILLNDHDELEKLLQRGVIRGGIKFPVVTNDKVTIRNDLSFVRAIPMNLYVNRDGKIYMRTEGGIQNEESFEEIKSIIDSELLK